MCYMENGISWQDSEVQISRSCRVKHFLSKTVDRKKKKRCLDNFKKTEIMLVVIAFG